MIDRIEELLAGLAEEDKDEDENEKEQEDVLARKRAAVVSGGLNPEQSESGEAPEGRTAFAQPEDSGRAANRRSETTQKRAAAGSGALGSERSESGEAPEGRTAFALSESSGRAADRRSETTQRLGAAGSGGLSSERSESGEAPEGRTAFARSESSGRAANRRSDTTQRLGAAGSGALRSERSESGEVPGGRTAFARPESLGRAADRRNVTTGEITSRQPEPTAGEFWNVGPVWTVQSTKPETARTRRTETAEQTVQAGEVLQLPQGGESTLAGLERAAQAGLEGLYRKTVRGLRPIAPALPPEQAGKTVRAQEPGSAASLAVDELDRAVRRDSRRYDGGMSIF